MSPSMEDSWASMLAADEIEKNPQHKLTITKTSAGYDLIHTYREAESSMGYTLQKNRRETPVSVRARNLDGKYLLEEKARSEGNYTPFGIEELSSQGKVDERLKERIKKRAIEYRDQTQALKIIGIEFD